MLETFDDKHEDFIKYCVYKLGIQECPVYIEYTNEVDWGSDCANGYVDYDEDTNSYDIEILNNMSDEDTMKAIAHELMHVNQIYYGSRMDDTLPYHERPYEIEACNMSILLYDNYQRELKYGNNTDNTMVE